MSVEICRRHILSAVRRLKGRAARVSAAMNIPGHALRAWRRLDTANRLYAGGVACFTAGGFLWHPVIGFGLLGALLIAAGIATDAGKGGRGRGDGG